jgi:type IV pilus assembly protein PilO
VTLHDFVVEAKADSEKKSDIPVVNYSIKAKTYRYIGADESKLRKNL